MSYQEIREKHHQFFVSMFIATFLGATFFTTAGHFFIGTFGNDGKIPALSFQYLIIPILVVAGLVSYLLPWMQLPFARNAFKFWIKGQSQQTKVANIIPYLILSFMPLAFAMLPIIFAIDAGSKTYLGPLFVGGAFAFFGMSILQSFLPLRVYFRKFVMSRE